MVRHFIILSSSYSQGQRVALDMVGLDQSNLDRFFLTVEKLKVSVEMIHPYRHIV